MGARRLRRRTGSSRRAIRDSASGDRRAHPEVDDAGRTHSAAPGPDAGVHLHHRRLRYGPIKPDAKKEKEHKKHKRKIHGPFLLCLLWLIFTKNKGKNKPRIERI